MNNVKSKTFSMTPNELEEKTLSSEKFRVLFNFKWMK